MKRNEMKNPVYFEIKSSGFFTRQVGLRMTSGGSDAETVFDTVGYRSNNFNNNSSFRNLRHAIPANLYPQASVIPGATTASARTSSNAPKLR
jgi:hypothetical protein